MSIEAVVIMSTIVLALSFVVDDNPYSESLGDTAIIETEVKEDWAIDAILNVAFYLRLHKFNDFDRR